MQREVVLMAIRKHQDKYRAYFKFQGKQYSRVVNTQAEGRAWMADEKRRLAKLAEQQAASMKHLTYSRGVRDYLLDCQARMQANTLNEKILHFREFADFLGRDIPMSVVTALMAKGFAAEMQRDRGNKAANRRIRNLKACWNWHRGELSENPWQKIKMYGEEEYQKRVPSRDELAAVLQSAESWEKHLLVVLLHTGARLGEVFELRWEDVNLELVARRTPGFTGADLANVLNEAALLTARSDAQLIDNRALDEAIDRVIAGPQRRTRVMKDQEKLITAYHEGGHALAAAAMRHTDPVTKITILPRGRALGYTMVLPLEDKYSVTRNELLDQLAYAMGGRVAEEAVLKDPTTGASNDIEKATGIARKMVTEYGMSSDIGSVKLGQSSGEMFLGRDMGHQRDYSERIAERVDAEVRALIEKAHDEAWQVINDNRDILDHLARELLEKETLDHHQIAEIFKDVKKLPERPEWVSADNRVSPGIPPIAFPEPETAPIDGGVVDGGVDSGVAGKPKRSRQINPRPATA